MFADSVPTVAIVFVALSVVFTAVSLRDYLVREGKLTPARRTWLRLSLIFAGIAVGLYVWHTLVA
jgi:hypothetical protein